jgi:hypothetical protein
MVQEMEFMACSSRTRAQQSQKLKRIGSLEGFGGQAGGPSGESDSI